MTKLKPISVEDIETGELTSFTEYEQDHDRALDGNGNYPGETARDRLIDAIEVEKADHIYQLTKYSDDELKAELLRRKPF